MSIHREWGYASPWRAAKRPSGRYLVVTLLALVVITAGYGATARQDDLVIPNDFEPPAPFFALEALMSTSSIVGTVARGESSFTLLREAGVSSAEVMALREAVREVYDIRHLRPGQPYSIKVAPEGQLVHFTYEIDTENILEVERQEQTFVGRLLPIEYERKERVVQATIDASISAALAEQGEDLSIATDLAEIFVGDLDFYTDLRRGDTVRLVLEDRYRDGQRLGYHRILAAELINQERVWQAVFYPHAEAQGTYYRPDGSSMRRMFLRSPLQYTRISSQFSLRRYHPVLKKYRPHLGIDYAAPMGTPVLSVGDGKVTWAGRKGANGKMVTIQHDPVYATYYLHLSRFANDLRVGMPVTQGQIIGYVGSTGLSTGPHLDFRMTKHGKFLNPLGHDTVVAAPLPREVLPAFRTYAKRLLVALGVTAHR